jgi:hypothetical protein
MESFIEITERNIERLMDEDGHLEATARGIEQRRAELRREIEKGLTALDYYRQVMGVPANLTSSRVAQQGDATPVSVKVVEPRRHRRGQGETVADRVEDFMKANGNEALVADVAAHLIEMGLYPEDERQGLYRRVYSTMLRDKRFYKVEPGKFGLVPQGKSLSLAHGTTTQLWKPESQMSLVTNMGNP